MPFYTWRRKDDNAERVDVFREYKDYEQQPTNEEYKDADKYEWERIIGKTLVNKGDTWGSGKGSW